MHILQYVTSIYQVEERLEHANFVFDITVDEVLNFTVVGEQYDYDWLVYQKKKNSKR